MKVIQNKFSLSFLIAVLSLFLASINFRYGYFEDVDVLEIIQSAWRFPSEGWGPSRSWGFPLYEFFLYPTIYYFGLTGAKVQSLFFYVLSGLLFFKLLRYLTKNNIISFLGACCFIVHPIAIISGNSIVATSQEIFLALLALSFFFWFFKKEKAASLFLIFVFAGFATATRQDYFVLAVSMTATLLFFRRISFVQLALCFFIYLMSAAGPYFIFYGVDHFSTLSTEFLQNEGFLRKFFRSVFGYLAIFGIPTIGFLVVYGIHKRPAFKELRDWILNRPPAFLFVCSVLLYFIRFNMLADKLEYVWILFPLLVIVISHFQRKGPLLLLLITTLIPNFLQIHLFRRERGLIKMAVGFSPGAIVQDRSGRLKNQYRFFGNYVATVAKVAKEKFGCQNHFWYLAEPPDESYCIVVPEEMLRFWNPDRLTTGVDRKKLFDRKIIVFNFPENRGWRQFMKFKPWKQLEPQDFHLFSVQ